MEPKSPRTVEADDVDSGGHQLRFQHAAKEILIAAKRTEKAVEGLVDQRDIVISRNDQPRLWKLIHKTAGG